MENETPAIRSDELSDREQLLASVKTLLYVLAPGYVIPNNIYFYPIDIAPTFTINTNLDFAAINAERHKLVPTDNITPASILAWIQTARSDARMAADYMAELITKDESSSLIRLKLVHLMRKRDKNISQMDLFQETTLNQCRSIREAINSGERSFAQFFTVLDKADRFKDWLDQKNPDANLLTEYYNSIVADGPMSSLPVKIARYMVTTALGLLIPEHPAIGIAAAGVDSFLVDRLARGWRPNHFVDGPLKKFVDLN